MSHVQPSVALGCSCGPDRTVVLLRSTGSGFTGFGPENAISTEPLVGYPVGDILLADIDLDGTATHAGISYLANASRNGP